MLAAGGYLGLTECLLSPGLHWWRGINRAWWLQPAIPALRKAEAIALEVRVLFGSIIAAEYSAPGISVNSNFLSWKRSWAWQFLRCHPEHTWMVQQNLMILLLLLVWGRSLELCWANAVLYLPTKLQPSPVLACKKETITLLASLFPCLNILLPSLPLSPLPFPSPLLYPLFLLSLFYPLPLSTSTFFFFLLPFLLSLTLHRVSLCSQAGLKCCFLPWLLERLQDRLPALLFPTLSLRRS